ncbi:MAG TPA: FTR1 family protein [Longimicrobiales bacterium]|nr:FTR1 family protein [Longimicrobiales bacterium]
MKRAALVAACLLCGSAASATAQSPVHAKAMPLVLEWVAEAESGVAESQRLFQAGEADAARARLLRVYLDRFEGVEAYYGPNGPHATPALSDQVSAAEAVFHALLSPDLAAGAAALRAGELVARIQRIAAMAEAEGVADARAAPLGTLEGAVAQATSAPARAVRTPEIRAILDELAVAEEALARDRAAALGQVEHAYLEGFEPIESRLPSPLVGRIERLIHLQLRPALAPNGDAAAAPALFAQLRGELLEADAFLAGGGSFWFGAINSFAIIVREGLEAVLLIGALLAYLSATKAGARPRRQIFVGLAAGLVASVGTWVLASTILPISGGNRELVEGVTALVAVAVLLYVSHWLFQKTYVHDWKEYLRQHAGQAVAKGSALAMASLAFAAVYREGFETVLFYQALQYDVGTRAILAGFVPGAVLITALGVAIVRYGVKLPIRRVFAVTNVILLYLAFTFLGKGLYNLQEAGLFSPAPLSWLPDHQAMRQLFGIYPVVQTLAAQLAFITLVAATFLLYRVRQGATAARTAAPGGYQVRTSRG